MTVDEIEATFRVGCCSSARLASEGCKVCGPQMRAIEAVREMARERDELRARLTTERDASAWARLPVPACCEECPVDRFGDCELATISGAPPMRCPIRAELAKAGGP